MTDRSHQESTGARRYTAVLLAATVLPLVGLAVFNGCMDPLAALGDPASTRPEGLNQHRLIKPRGLDQGGLALAILGSSRMEIGFDPDHETVQAFAGGRAYNAALADASIYETARLAEHAIALHGTPRLLVGLDFYTFQLAPQAKGGWSEDRLAVGPRGNAQPLYAWADLGRLLWSLDVTRSAWRTRKRLGTPAPAAELRYRRTGHRNDVHAYVIAHGGCRGAFRHKELGEMLERGTAFYRDLRTPTAVAASWEALDRLLATAARAQVELDLVLPPVHMRFQELTGFLAEGAAKALAAYRADPGWPGDPWAGGWGIAAWKTRLVRHVDRVRQAHPEARIRLWDFMTCNRYTDAALVPAGPEHRMPFHREPSHFTPEVGDAMLERIGGAGDDAGDPLADFGVRLDGGNLATHLEIQARRRAAWRAAYPADMAELATDWALVCEDPVAARREWARR